MNKLKQIAKDISNKNESVARANFSIDNKKTNDNIEKTFKKIDQQLSIRPLEISPPLTRSSSNITLFKPLTRSSTNATIFKPD